MHCPKCGNTIREGVKFCSGCGNSLNENRNPINNHNRPNKFKSTVLAIFSVIVFLVVFVGVRHITKRGVEYVSNEQNPSKQEMIEGAVQYVKDTTIFPSELDEATTFTGISGTSDAIVYYYTLHDIDPSLVSNESLEDMLLSSLCQNPDTRYLLDSDINMEYSYSIKDTGQKFFVSITKIDCL